MRKNNKTGKRLHLIPLILGGYGTFLGLGLVAIGFAEIKEGIGVVRLLLGLGMAGFGLLGIWDGVRDLCKPNKKPEETLTSQFILTDSSGNRSSLVTAELLREQLDILAESEEPKGFAIQMLPPLSLGECGLLKQILCIYHDEMILVAFFEILEGRYRIYQKRTETDRVAEWLKQLLVGNPDFSEWEDLESKAQQEDESVSQNEEDIWQEKESHFSGETGAPQEDVEAFWHQLLDDQKGRMNYWHQLLVIFGESWHDEHKFFSARDVELAIAGIHEGKYLKAVLELGTQAIDLFPGIQDEILVIWCTNNTGKGDTRFLAKEGTVTQVNFWLVNYLSHGFFKELSGWADVTAQIEHAKRKGERKHGKVF